MRLEQRFSLDSPIGQVWSAFHDPALVVGCLPGAGLAPTAGEPAPSVDSELPLTFKVKLGPIAAQFGGKGRITLDEATRTGTFTGQAVDTRTGSRVKGEAGFAVVPGAAGGTGVSLSVDYSIAGALAQFSREGIVRALAEQLTAQFAANLQARLVAIAPPAPSAAAATAVEPPAAPAASATPSAPDIGTTGRSAPAIDDSTKAAPADGAPALDLWRLIKTLLRGLFGRRKRA